MGQGIRGGRINQGSGSPINDWDPTVMEEDVMLDLTGYTPHTYDYWTPVDLGAGGETVILISTNSETASNVYGENASFSGSENGNAVLSVPPLGVLKVVFPYRYISSGTKDVTVWVKN